MQPARLSIGERTKNLNNIEKRALEMQSTFEQIGTICLKHEDRQRFAVLTFAAPKIRARLSLFDRRNYAQFHDAIAAPNLPIAHYDDFKAVATDGWRID
ncbi:MAG: hypothetical protein COC12_01630 [Rhodobacteraceae bacterium]|nr:MAG: hypothetical protein COC12_01630 [Paracoccaceae bacterium]